MTEKAFAQKRSGQRLSFLADADVVLPDGTSIPAQLDELSLHGCYLDTLEPLSVGTQFHLRIVDGDKATEKLGDFLDLQEAHDTAFRPMRPRTPRGKNNTMSTKKRPMKDIQFCVSLDT